MPPVKIFISHSSRLDELDAEGRPAEFNWNLLKETCEKLEAKYGDAIEILVDYRIRVADAWEGRLHEWLAECHVAIILFSKRAAETSNWVKKEATILSWRKLFDPSLKIVPVMLDGMKPEKLAEDYFGILHIDASQCIRDAACAGDILSGLEDAGLANFDAVQTPFDKLTDSIVRVIVEEISEPTLAALWNELNLPPVATGAPDRARRYAAELARHLLRDDKLAIERWITVIDKLAPKMEQQHAEELLKSVRALWISPGAAGMFPLAIEAKQFLAVNGELIAHGSPSIGTECYTLERYAQRAWPDTDRLKVVPLTEVKDIDDLRDELRRRLRPDSRSFPPARIDAAIKKDSRHIVVLFPATSSELPDLWLSKELKEMQRDFPNLLFVFPTGAALPETLPDGIRAVEPPLDIETEYEQYDWEFQARELIAEKYGT